MSQSYAACLGVCNFPPNYNPTFLDVGCNINPINVPNETLDDFTQLFLSKYPGAIGYGIEPMHWQAYQSKWENDSRITLVKKALASSNKPQAFYAPGAHALSSLVNRKVFESFPEYDEILNQVTEVECITVDALMTEENIRRIDYLKVDTEGSELPILHGAKDSFKEKKIKFIQLEYGQTYGDAGYSIEDVTRYLEEYNYSKIFQTPEEIVFSTSDYTY